MYHPAAALHQPALRDSIIADFAGLPRFLDLARSRKDKIPNEETTEQEYSEPVEDIGISKKDESMTPTEAGENPQQLSLFNYK
jgi:DNA polymerase